MSGNIELVRIVESLLFSSDVPLPAGKLKVILEVPSVSDIKKAVKRLQEKYEKAGSSLKIIEVAGGYRLATREEFAPFIKKLYKGRSASRLTRRGLETLAIIAYKQPITKQEVESIRGVNSDAVIKTLLERNLITVTGREKAPGNPLLYGTTKYFLEYFGLNSLDALPKLKEIDELLKSDDQFLESLDQVALEQLAPEKLGMKTALEEPMQKEVEKKNGEAPKKNPDTEESEKTPVENESGKNDTSE